MWVALGALLHVSVLLLPIWFFGSIEKALSDWTSWAFLSFATCLYLVEWSASAATKGRAYAAPTVDDRRAYKWALVTGIVLLLIFWSSLVERSLRQPAAVTAFQAFGLGLLGAGVWLRYAAIRALGRRFVNEVRPQQDDKLLEDGIYAYLRHPSETGLLAIALGTSLALGSVFGLALCIAVLLPVVLWRLRLEDHHLAIHFGNDFARYADRVRVLAPFF